MITIRPLEKRHVTSCVEIMRMLPAWFGIEAALQTYAKDLETLDGFGAFKGSKLIGFVGLKRFGDHAIEVNVIAVHPQFRCQGIGTRLMQEVERASITRHTKLLHTKTVASSKVSAAYAETREFWTDQGFIAIDEHLLWGPENPCLVLAKILD